MEVLALNSNTVRNRPVLLDDNIRALRSLDREVQSVLTPAIQARLRLVIEGKVPTHLRDRSKTVFQLLLPVPDTAAKLLSLLREKLDPFPIDQSLLISHLPRVPVLD